MLIDYMESEYKTYRLSFGMHRGKLLSSLDMSYILWWLGKREHDETTGDHGIDPEHKIAAERVHKFNRNYMFFIFHVYKVENYRLSGSGVYQKTAQKFWEELDSGNNKMNFSARDELESFFISLWSEERENDPQF